MKNGFSTLGRSFAAAFSMFSSIPVPQVDWSAANMRYILCAFPFVGAAAGAAVYGWVCLCGLLGLGTILRAAGMALLPVAISGGIHLDGLADAADALASHSEPQRAREILHDPHTGAFGVIAVGGWLLLYFALCTQLTSVLPVCIGFMLSRCLSGLCVLLLPSGGEGLGKLFHDGAARRACIIDSLLAVLCAAAMLAIDLRSAAMLAAAALCVLYIAIVSKKRFGGMSGDLAGFFLEICEAAMLAAFVIAEALI